MRNVALAIVGFVTLVGAFSLGVLVGQRSSKHAVPKPDPLTPNLSVAPVAAPADTPKPATPKVKGTVETPQAPPLARARIWSEINDKLRAKVRVPLLAGDGLNPDIATILGLTAEESAALGHRILDAKQQISRLEAAHATVQPLSDGKYAIKIAAFPQEGGAALDSLMHDIHQTLGDERFAYLQSLSDPNDLTSGLGVFGLEEVSIDLAPFAGPNGRTGGLTYGSLENGVMRQTVQTNTQLFKTQYPEIYKRMVAEGTWQDAPTNP